MNRHPTARILLSLLLLWQLGAGVFVHAHGVAAMNMQHAAAMAADPAPAVEEHCAEHASMQMPADMHAHMTPDDDRSTRPGDSHPDCCRSFSCNCPCMQALALSPSLPYVPTARPDALTAQTFVIPSLHAGISGLFRPPI